VRAKSIPWLPCKHESDEFMKHKSLRNLVAWHGIPSFYTTDLLEDTLQLVALCLVYWYPVTSVRETPSLFLYISCTCSHPACSATKMTATMKACYFDKYGPADKVLKMGNFPIPVLEGPHDVLVKVHAAALNPTDYKQTEGELKAILERPFPILPGMDFSGVVVKKGEAVDSRFNIGDEVFGMVRGLRTGTTAEFVVVNDHILSHKPQGLSHKEAAGVPLAAITAFQCLEKSGFKYPPEDNSGKSLFLTGGPGGVGTFLIQLAKKVFKIGTVVTTASGEKGELCKSLGADETIDYRKTNFVDALKGRSFDACIDLSGDTSKMVGFVKPNGALTTILTNITSEMLREWLGSIGPHPGMKPLGIVKGAVNNIPSGIFDIFTGAGFLRHRLARGATFHSIITVSNGAVLDTIGQHLVNKDIKVVIDQVFPLDNAIDAYLRVMSGKAVGKVIVEVVAS
jgi:NADPH:quinone reductase-like Zn-dependent oxidoreductase